ncbi:hypothetical protein ACO0LM_22220 [Undibacterium sp. Di26W]|uniref:hypothetical protein n=1 Tax=Undibacterium sp. Di26W TaxID=3413035 RepID=UPI003BEF612D
MKTGAYEYAASIEKRIEILSMEQYHLRHRPANRLIEELYPLSRLALALKQPGLTVDVEAFEDSGGADGHIWISGYLTKDFDVEVTFAGYGREEALRSELLIKNGFAPGAGPIERDTKTKEIVATMEAQDYYAPVELLATSIGERLRAKVAKQYSEGTVLLIAFEDMRLRGRGWWQLLYTMIWWS